MPRERRVVIIPPSGASRCLTVPCVSLLAVFTPSEGQQRGRTEPLSPSHVRTHIHAHSPLPGGCRRARVMCGITRTEQPTCVHRRRARRRRRCTRLRVARADQGRGGVAITTVHGVRHGQVRMVRPSAAGRQDGRSRVCALADRHPQPHQGGAAGRHAPAPHRAGRLLARRLHRQSHRAHGQGRERPPPTQLPATTHYYTAEPRSEYTPHPHV